MKTPYERIGGTYRREGVTEQLKAQDQMEWVRRRNSIRNRTEEAIYHMLINS